MNAFVHPVPLLKRGAQDSTKSFGRRRPVSNNRNALRTPRACAQTSSTTSSSRPREQDAFDSIFDARVTLALHGAVFQAIAGAASAALQEAASLASLPLTALLPNGDTPAVSAAHRLGDPDSVFVPTVPQHIRVHAKVSRAGHSTLNPDQSYDALLLHGALGSAFCFRRILAPLANLLGGTAAAFDRPPFGLTEARAVPDYSLPGEAALTASVSRALRLRRGRVILVGHSLGGAVALRAALDAPDAVAGVVLLAPALRVPYPGPVRAAARLALAHPAFGRSLVRRRMTDVARRAEADLRLPPEVHDGYTRPMRREHWDEGFREYMRAFQGFDVWHWEEELHALDLPVLVVAAEADAVVSEHGLDRLCKALPRATLAKLEGVTHLMFEDDPDALFSVVQRWARGNLGV